MHVRALRGEEVGVLCPSGVDGLPQLELGVVRDILPLPHTPADPALAEIRGDSEARCGDEEPHHHQSGSRNRFARSGVWL
jgi:hypothetical protein